MRFGRMLAVMAAIGAAFAGRVASGAEASAPGPGLGTARWSAAGNHRFAAPNPTGALRIQRAAKKRRNQARHRAQCRSGR